MTVRYVQWVPVGRAMRQPPGANLHQGRDSSRVGRLWVPKEAPYLGTLSHLVGRYNPAALPQVLRDQELVLVALAVLWPQRERHQWYPRDRLPS